MILSAHSNATYLNFRCARSRAGSRIILSKNTPVPSLKGPVLTIAQIIKNVMSSAAEAELSVQGHDTPQEHSHRYGLAATPL